MDTLKKLMEISNNESERKIKKIMKNCGLKSVIRSVTKKSDDYDEKYMKIKFNSDGELPLNKTIKISVMVIVVRAVFRENSKYYASKECDICRYWHFLNYSFKFQPNVCNRFMIF